MNPLTVKWSELYSNYRDWVRRNPQTASEVETTVKWLSYFIAGKINKSVVLTELVYSASNLLVLFNDIIIYSAKQKVGSSNEKVKIWLTVLEYSEVFIEISSKSLWGEKGKWIVIVCVQLLKCVARLVLLLHYKEKIISCPPVLPCKRNQEKGDGGNKTADGIPRINNIAFSLKRSGRVIRKVDSDYGVESTIIPQHTRLICSVTLLASQSNFPIGLKFGPPAENVPPTCSYFKSCLHLKAKYHLLGSSYLRAILCQAPPLNSRVWKPPSLPSYNHSSNNNLEEQPDKALLQQHLIGEVLYIVKPVVNLLFMMKYGQSTWRPWTVSAALDVISLYLLLSKSKNQTRKFSSSQHLELSRRRLILLLYLMRSPFYEKYSKNRINAFLSSLSLNLPLARLICTPLQQYLPHWQETYFYLWSS